MACDSTVFTAAPRRRLNGVRAQARGAAGSTRCVLIVAAGNEHSSARALRSFPLPEACLPRRWLARASICRACCLFVCLFLLATLFSIPSLPSHGLSAAHPVNSRRPRERAHPQFQMQQCAPLDSTSTRYIARIARCLHGGESERASASAAFVLEHTSCTCKCYVCSWRSRTSCTA